MSKCQRQQSNDGVIMIAMIIDDQWNAHKCLLKLLTGIKRFGQISKFEKKRKL